MLVLAPPRDKGPVEATCLHLRISISGGSGTVVREDKKALMLPIEEQGQETVLMGTMPASSDAVGKVTRVLEMAVSARGEFWYERFLLALLESQGRGETSKKKDWGEKSSVVFQGVAGRLSVLAGHGRITL